MLETQVYQYIILFVQVNYAGNKNYNSQLKSNCGPFFPDFILLY